MFGLDDRPSRRRYRRKLNRTIDDIISDVKQIDSMRSDQIDDAYLNSSRQKLDPTCIQLLAVIILIAGFLQ